MFLLNELKEIVNETHPNKSVQAFYMQHLERIANEHTALNIEFNAYNDLLTTCITLLIETDQTIENIIQTESEDKKWQASELIQSLTFYTIIGRIIFKSVSNKELAVALFMYFNECQFRKISGIPFCVRLMCEDLFKIIK